MPDPHADADPSDRTGLTDRDRRILELEARTFRYVGAKERAIREELGISRTAYYVRLNALLDDPPGLRVSHRGVDPHVLGGSGASMLLASGSLTRANSAVRACLAPADQVGPLRKIDMYTLGP